MSCQLAGISSSRQVQEAGGGSFRPPASCTCLLLLLLSSNINGQVLFEKTKHNFGQIEKGSNRVADFTLINKTSATAFILRAEVDREMSIRYSTKRIMPDSTAVIRLKYNPTDLGAFRKKIPVYVSTQPTAVTLILDGVVNYIDERDTPDCPDFSNNDVALKMSFGLKVIVLNKMDNKPIPNVEVKLIQGVASFTDLHTDAQGRASSRVPLGLYTMIVNADGYQTIQSTQFLNRNNANITFRLQPLPREREPPEPKAPTELPDQAPIIEEIPLPQKKARTTQEITEFALGKREEVQPDEPIEEVKAPFTDPNELSREEFIPNNIVFLIDISSSMSKRNRIELLKISVIEMLKMLRDIDRVAIVTYASQTSLLLPSCQANKKDAITAKVEALNAEGYTAGGKGIRRAYSVAERNYIENGNNQVIIATDGDFDIYEDKDLIPTIRRNAKRGISLSVVGIRNGMITFESLQEIAAKGGGHYVRITDEEDALSVLVEEIKLSSRRE